MTEAEWLGSTIPDAMETYVSISPDSRKLRLYAAACCRRVVYLAGANEDREAVDIAERLADGLATNAERRGAAKAASVGWRGRFSVATQCALAVGAREAAVTAADHAVLAVIEEHFPLQFELGENSEAIEAIRRQEQAAQATLLRDVFGNPFRPVAFDPAWRTDTAVALANQMYDSGDFGAMPILADALQDAGCDSEDILSHCRDASASHVRGCWVVDLVLRKE